MKTLFLKRSKWITLGGKVIHRNAPVPTGGYLEQADGTAWMALFCQNMLKIAIELARTDADYADMALKLIEHFLWIASGMGYVGADAKMWDEEDGFFYDVIRLPNGQAPRVKVRSMVGLTDCQFREVGNVPAKMATGTLHSGSLIPLAS